jgi:hypothetical protein
MTPIESSAGKLWKHTALGCVLALSLCSLPLHAATKGYNLGTPGLDDGPQLVTLNGEPAVRYPVAHQHAASGCGGYLYFSERTIRFEVLHPDKDKSHAFEYARADLVVAQPWKFMGSTMPEAEFKFRDGRVFHFFRVRRKLAENESEKMTWDNVLPFEALLEAGTNFPAALALAQSSQNLLAGGANAAPAAAAPAASVPPPLEDSAALGAAGLDIAPPPPWLRAGAAPVASRGGEGGRP